jgi:glycosyltransferase involved in cell wall biosynthesis
MKNSTEKKKIIVMGAVPPPYMGPTLATSIILNSSLKDRYEIIHLDTSDHRDLQKLGKIDFGNIWLALKHYFLLAWLILRHRPEAVYTPSTQTAIGLIRDSGFVYITKILGCKIMCHLRGGNFRNFYDKSNFLMRWYIRQFHKLIDTQLILGPSLASIYDGIVKPEKVCVVPNGRNFQHAPVNKDQTHEPVTVLYLSNFLKTKGVVDTMNSIPEIASKYPRTKFIFGGGKREESTWEYMHQFAKTNKEYNIEIVSPAFGELKERILRESHILVFPTFASQEGHPWVLIEAMAYSMVMISTHRACIPELVLDKHNGYIIPPHRPDVIAQKIISLIQNPSLRQQMAFNSRQHYLKNFTEHNLVEAMDNCINKTLRAS